ncbi:hypothetical protein B0I35DRAFT_438815 [Stachybotrys elegans]|uniref:Uncharacterized protein n=1 Tax=Stachybotrys elegans TaxID=80388 RepID=A0A8K0SQ63_9HYPO|nr:hypothetical protein B0I35DRAFT_438815 [Stachybotrys elegans]
MMSYPMCLGSSAVTGKPTNPMRPVSRPGGSGNSPITVVDSGARKTGPGTETLPAINPQAIARRQAVRGTPYEDDPPQTRNRQSSSPIQSDQWHHS